MQKEGEAGGGHGHLGIKLHVHDIISGGGGLFVSIVFRRKHVSW